MTYGEWLDSAFVAFQAHQASGGRQRFGQYLFNSLNDVRPDLAHRVRGTDDDAFYNDSKWPEMCGVAAYYWDK